MAHLFSLRLERADGTPFPTVTHKGQTWTVLEPQDEFQVHIMLLRRLQDTVEVVLQVDGQSVGTNYMFHDTTRPGTPRLCVGYLQAKGYGGRPSTYRAFKASKCQPGAAATVVNTLDALVAGKITADLSAMMAVGKKSSSSSHHSAPVLPGSAAESKKLPEGKKFFLAPGLKAEAGSARREMSNWSNTRYVQIRSLGRIQLRYDCSESLLLRKVLSMDDPAHRQILRRSSNPAIAAQARAADEAEAASEDDAPEPAAAAAGSRRRRTGRVKRERVSGVKREHAAAAGADGAAAAAPGGDNDAEDSFVIPRSATAPTVDLTAEPVRPLVVNGRALQADEVAVCDLCDSDGEGAEPGWQVQKKQAIEVTEM